MFTIKGSANKSANKGVKNSAAKKNAKKITRPLGRSNTSPRVGIQDVKSSEKIIASTRFGQLLQKKIAPHTRKGFLGVDKTEIQTFLA